MITADTAKDFADTADSAEALTKDFNLTVLQSFDSNRLCTHCIKEASIPKKVIKQGVILSSKNK
jgi:hypothetical protein